MSGSIQILHYAKQTTFYRIFGVVHGEPVIRRVAEGAFMAGYGLIRK